jgi:hypothetical protein
MLVGVILVGVGVGVGVGCGSLGCIKDLWPEYLAEAG